MSATVATLLAIVGFLLSLLRAFLNADLIGRTPRHCERVIARQVKRLEPGERELMSEIWLGELGACNSRPLTALWWAHIVVRRGCGARVREIARAQRREFGFWRPTTRPGQALLGGLEWLIDQVHAEAVRNLLRDYPDRPKYALQMLALYAGELDIEIVANRRSMALDPDLKCKLREARAASLGQSIEGLAPSHPHRLKQEGEYSEIRRLLDSGRR